MARKDYGTGSKDIELEDMTKSGSRDGGTSEPTVQIPGIPSIQAESPQLDATPKARPTQADSNIPSFTLEGTDPDSEDEDKDLPPPMFPAFDSAQRASVMAPPPKPTPKPPSPGLMPPPAPRAPTTRTAPSVPSSLRVPTNGPLPNRGPPASAAAQSRMPASLAPTSTISVPNPRAKVLLKPGHSPLDWATLARSSNLSGVSTFQRVTPSMLKHNNGRKGKPTWSSYQGKVYNIAPYLPFHPGGEGQLMRAAGKDGYKLFHEVHPWVNWDNMLSSCVVGIMVPEGQGDEGLEGLD